MTFSRTLHSLTALFLLTAFLFSTTSVTAQQTPQTMLFEADIPAQVGAELPDHELSRHYLRMNRAALAPGELRQGQVIGYRFGGEIHSFVVERVGSYTEGTFSILARGEDGFGNHLSLTVEEDRVLGSIHLHNFEELYHLQYDRERQSNYIARVDAGQMDVMECGLDSEHHSGRLMELHNDLPEELRRHQERIESAEPLASSHVATIGVMIVYTPNARDWMNNSQPGSVNQVIGQAMNRSQLSIDNSNINIEFDLVHTHMTDFDESEVLREINGELRTDSPTILRKFTTSPDFQPFEDDDIDFTGHMDEVHNLRDQHGADLVALFAELDDVGGIAWLLRSTQGWPHYAFSVNRVQQMHWTETLVHEWGHNMGLHHSRNQALAAAPPDGGLFEYSTGWRWDGNDGNNYVSVMTYTRAADGVTDGISVPYFSNPDVIHQGQPTGSYSGQYAPADAARSLNEIRHVIASYRETTDPTTTPDPPTLVSPADGALHQPRAVELEWGEVSNATAYRVQAAADAGFNQMVINQQTTSTTHTASPPLDYLTDYHWRVRSKNEAGSSAWSSVREFQTIIEAPENVVLSWPENEAFQIPVDAQLSWQEAARASEYIIEISEEPDFGEIMHTASVAETHFSRGDLFEPASTYYWRVRAANIGGLSDWSPGRSFTTVVEETLVEANYPNPFRDMTTFDYQLSDHKEVLIDVYDTAGRRVAVLVDELQEPRIYSIRFDASGLASGVYILRMSARSANGTGGNFSDIQRFTVIR